MVRRSNRWLSRLSAGSLALLLIATMAARVGAQEAAEPLVVTDYGFADEVITVCDGQVSTTLWFELEAPLQIKATSAELHQVTRPVGSAVAASQDGGEATDRVQIPLNILRKDGLGGGEWRLESLVVEAEEGTFRFEPTDDGPMVLLQDCGWHVTNLIAKGAERRDLAAQQAAELRALAEAQARRAAAADAADTSGNSQATSSENSTDLAYTGVDSFELGVVALGLIALGMGFLELAGRRSLLRRRDYEV